ncbi:hypothetical protein pEaSNUABM8_00216 [Erwinia phage pEa_SNUABM_8]|nr:hypothetical protein pEaSNUABM8_00216 [Erwinia phage pEa_SNUABM_8]QVW54968.1 hypothetical protein pEaSNUABM4_00215 [Erwinia phage pEa_SNUABM_4]
MFNLLVVAIGWLCGAAYVAGLGTAILFSMLWPLPGRALDSCWKKYKESK